MDSNLRAEVKARVGALVRNAAGLPEAALTAGVTRVTLSAWHQGLRKPRSSNLFLLRALTS